MTEINQRVRDIADQIKSSTVFSNDFLTINPVTKEMGCEDPSHVIIKADNNIYEKNLPDGITLETIKTLKEYNSDFEAGVLLGVGESTLKLMGDNDSVTCTTAFISSEPGKHVTTYISNSEDPFETCVDDSTFSFYSHVKDNRLIERIVEEPTQKQIVRRHLTELYTKALCETVK